MFLHTLSLTNFRNFDSLCISFSKEGTFFFGENGSGKTNILESIHQLCTGRSQRNASKIEIIKYQRDYARVDAHFLSEKENKEVHFLYSFDKKNNTEIYLNGIKQRSFSDWFGTQPIVSFSPSDTEIIYGYPDVRRKFIDMLICLVDHEYLYTLMKYRRNLLERNKMLKSCNDENLFMVYENIMSSTGEKLFECRKKMLEELSAYVREEYSYLSGKTEWLSLRYFPSVPLDKSSLKTWKNVFFSMLSDRRKRDRETGFCSCGPHRDDMLLSLDSKPAKSFSSQGQCRTIALALKLGSLRYLENHGQCQPIVLFDDAVSELDAKRTNRVLSCVFKRGQVMIASPHQHFDGNDQVKRYHVQNSTAIQYDR